MLIAAAILVLLLGLAAIVWHARIVFVVQLQQRTASCRRGTPPPGFVPACTDVARMHRVDRGRITGVRTGAGIELRFSSEIPAHAHQAFRNVWTPPPSGGTGGGIRATG